MRTIKLIPLAAAALLFTGAAAAAAGVMLGDADTSGEVTIGDVTAIQRTLAELPVSGYSSSAADVDGSGGVDISDATLIQMWLADMGTPYEIGVVPTEPPTEPTTQCPTDSQGWGYVIFQP